MTRRAAPTVTCGVLISLLALMLLLGGCAPEPDLDDYYRIRTDYTGVDLSPEPRLVASTETLELYYTPATAAVEVIDLRSGASWRSNPAEPDPGASPLNRQLMASQIAMTLYTPAAKASYLNSAPEAIDRGQVDWESIDNGVRVVYTLGEIREILLIPQVIERSRYEAFFERIEDESLAGQVTRQYRLFSLENAHTETQRERMLDSYPQLVDYDLYEFSGVENRGILQRLVDAFASAGYTLEDLNEDNRQNNVPEQEQNPRIYSFTVEYRLDGDSLVVSVPGSEILGHPSYPLTSFRFLSYFGAAPAGTEGYIVVPDGEGALIRFDNDRLYSSSYISSVYGYDPADPPNELIGIPLPIMLPVFGMKRGDDAFIATIEEGASLARVYADISGRVSRFNTVGPEFFYRPFAPVELESLQGNKDVNVYQEEGFRGDYRIRYTFLTGESANYVGMADVIHDQLMAERELQADGVRPSTDDYPLFIDIYGAIDLVKQFAGIPYRGVEALTPFHDAQSLLADLEAGGASDLVVRYLGWLEGGVYHDAAGGARVERAAGNTRELEELEALPGADVYFDLSLTRVMHNSSFDGFAPFRSTARFLNREPAFQRRYDIASFIPNVDDPGFFLLAPRLIPRTMDRVLRRADRYGADQLSFRFLGQNVHSDFRERGEIDREESLAISVAALRSAAEKSDGVMITGGAAFALPFAEAVVDVPEASTGHRLLDESIPFQQMVMRGMVQYSGYPVNLGDTSRRAFLRTLEAGASARFALITGDNSVVIDTDHAYLFSAGADVWMDMALDWYEELDRALGPVAGERIVDHQIDGNLRVVTYESGRRIVINYGDRPVGFEGEEIGGEDYRVYD